MAEAMDVGTLVGYVKIDDSGVATGLSAAQGKILAFGTTGAATATTAGKQIGGAAGVAAGTSFGGSLKSGFGKVAAVAGITGGLMAVKGAVGGVLSLGVDYQNQLNDMGAVTGATGDQMATVSAKARALGNDIQIPGTSAVDAAEAMTELAKGGLSVEQSMDAAKGTLQLAAAAQVDGATAATIQANALNTFGLSADQAGKVADVLANTANAASGEITDFAQGLAQGGSVAKLFGVNLEDTSTVLGIFANNGIKGSDAGTSLKSMLTHLATPSKQAAAAMDELGLQVYDSNGQFVGMRSLTEQLSHAQDRMTDSAFQSAAGILFGTDALRAASILASAGATSYDDMSSAIGRSGGAADLANARMKGLGGAMQVVENAVQEVALEIFDELGPSVESMVRGFAELIPGAADIVVPVIGGIVDTLGLLAEAGGKVVGFFNDLPAPVQLAVGALATLALAQKIGLLDKFAAAGKRVVGSVNDMTAGFTGATASFGSFGFKMQALQVQGFSKMGSAIAVVSSGVKSFGKNLLSAFGGPVGIAITGVTLALGFLFDAQHKASEEAAKHKQQVDELTDTLDKNTGAITDNTRETIKKRLEDSGVLKTLQDAGISLQDYTDGIMGNTDAQKRSEQQLFTHAKAILADSDEWKNLSDKATAAGISLDDYTRAQLEGGTALDTLSAKMETYNTKQQTATLSTKSGTAGVAELMSTVDSSTAVVGFNAAAIDGLRDAWSSAVDQSGQLKDATDAHARSVAADTDSTKAATGALEEGRTAAAASREEWAKHNNVVDVFSQYQNTARGEIASTVDAMKVANATNTDYEDSWSRMGGQIIDTTESVDRAADPIKFMADKIKNVGSETDIANQRLQFFTISIDELVGRDVTMEQATKLVNDQVRALAESTKKITEDTKGHTQALIDNTGHINTTTEAGSKLYDAVNSYRNAYDVATTATYNHSIAEDDLAGALGKAQAQADSTRATFIKQMESMGLTQTQAETLADAMGILEGKKLTDKDFAVRAEDKASAVVDAVNNKKIADKTFTITAIENLVRAVGPDGTVFHGRYAEGGWITGGVSGKDSVPILAMPGEAIIPTQAAQANRDVVNSLINGGTPGPAPSISGVGGTSSGGNGSITINLDGRQIARVVGPFLAKDIQVFQGAAR